MGHVDRQFDEVGEVGVVGARVPDLGGERFGPHGAGDPRLAHACGERTSLM